MKRKNEAWMVRCTGFDRGEEPLCHTRRQAQKKVECEDCEIVHLVQPTTKRKATRRKKAAGARGGRGRGK